MIKRAYIIYLFFFSSAFSMRFNQELLNVAKKYEEEAEMIRSFIFSSVNYLYLEDYICKEGHNILESKEAFKKFVFFLVYLECIFPAYLETSSVPVRKTAKDANSILQKLPVRYLQHEWMPLDSPSRLKIDIFSK